MGPLMIAGIAAQGLSSLFGAIKGGQMMKQAKAINPVFDTKQVDNMVGLAQNRLNSRNPYSEANRRAALTAQGNTLSNVQRNAIDPSQALAMAAGIGAQTDSSIYNLGQQDVAYDQQNVNNLMNAQQVSNQVMMQKYGMDMSQKNALQNAGQQTITSAFSNMAGTLMGAAGLPKTK